MKRLVLIGPINNGSNPCTGDTMKNQIFVKRFREVFDDVKLVDTYHWHRKPWCLLSLLRIFIFFRSSKIIVSANPVCADKIINLIRILGLSKNSFYWVIGGIFHKKIEAGEFSKEKYSSLKAVFVQSPLMVSVLNSCGLYNVKYVPNSKYIEKIPVKKTNFKSRFHFVFLSRIEKEKGCDDIIKASEILSSSGYKDKYDITFYGKATNEPSYQKIFEQKIFEHHELIYKGVLDLKQSENYNILAQYHVMLFPTFWYGEGFPGVIIDAYIAGLPVIASDWNFNSDVVEEGKTGWLVPVQNVNKLAEKMIFAIEHPEIVQQFSVNSSEKAMLYDTRLILSSDNLKRLEIL